MTFHCIGNDNVVLGAPAVGEAREEEAPSHVPDIGGPERTGLRENPRGVGPREGSWWRANAAPGWVTYVCSGGQD